MSCNDATLPQFYERAGAPRLAYHYSEGSGPVVVFCGGYRSDMGGTKAMYLQAQCAARGQGYLRFDYRGHGQSGGDFADGMIGAWLDDALAIITHCVPDGDIVIAGSSMGGWIGLCAAAALGARVRGLVGIAAAPDFTRDMVENRMDEGMRAALARDGRVLIPNDYSDEPYVFTKAFFDEAEQHLILPRRPHYSGALRFVQGQRDADVHWQTANRIKDAVTADGGVEVIFVPDGDHRLSRDEDLALIDAQVRAVSGV